ncbi:hypothetical protein [Pantoea stewartii]|uniref:hypothetical protein n=1 Tax=Pantoea stewartii TaxID=66269 RepID=UPI0013906997|nr:hypothetical protein [Pantoea stewartii]
MEVKIENRVMYLLRNLNDEDKEIFLNFIEKVKETKDKSGFRDFPQSTVMLHGQSIFSYKLSKGLRVFFSIVDDSVIVLDVVNKYKVDKFIK